MIYQHRGTDWRSHEQNHLTVCVRVWVSVYVETSVYIIVDIFNWWH